jgi:hypothetical protein
LKHGAYVSDENRRQAMQALGEVEREELLRLLEEEVASVREDSQYEA